MGKLLIPTCLYKMITETLKKMELINVIPVLKWTAKKSVYGYIRVDKTINKETKTTTKKEYTIYINKNIIPQRFKDMDGRINDITELIDTICHELAHMDIESHGVNHEKLTKLYKYAFYTEIGAENIINILEKNCL